MRTTKHMLPTPGQEYEAFWEGFVDCHHGLHHNPYDAVRSKEAEARAWDHGQEACKRNMSATGRSYQRERSALLRQS